MDVLKMQGDFDSFMRTLRKVIVEAMDEGTPARLFAGGDHEITVDIYKNKNQMIVMDHEFDRAQKEGRVKIVQVEQI